MTIRSIKKLINELIGLSLLFLCLGNAYAASGDAAPNISAEEGALYYQLGGGGVIPDPPSNYTTFNINGRFTMGLGYSCGEFNFQDNISEMVNQIKDKIRELPGQIKTAVDAAIAGLPAYLMQKYNPTLYNILTKTIDETFELFSFSFKTCEQIEAELAANPNANPYDDFMKASIAGQWDLASSSGALAADTREDIATDPEEPIEWLGGHLAGTVNNPIEINHDIAVAGYNIMIDRTNDVSLETIPPINKRELKVVKNWETPAAAGEWLQNIIGDKLIYMEDIPPGTTTTKVGHGLKQEVEEVEPLVLEALRTAVNDNDFTDINEYTTISVSANLVDSIRQMETVDENIFMHRLAQEIAVNHVQERIRLMQEMLLTGLRAPDFVKSHSGPPAEDYIRKVTLIDLDNAVAELIDNLDLKNLTFNRTTNMILDKAAHDSAKSRNITPGGVVIPSRVTGNVPAN